MASRGVWAELHRSARMAQRQIERDQRAVVREHEQALRQAERARNAEDRARQKAQRAAEADRKRMEKELLAAHVASMEAQVEQLNASLLEINEELDALLVSALEDDSYIEIEDLKREAVHPEFDPGGLDRPTVAPTVPPPPPEPVYSPPPAPTGLFGRKQRHAEAVAEAKAAFERAHRAWRAEVDTRPALVEAAEKEHAALEAQRLQELDEARARYDEACAAREEEVAAHNAEIDQLIVDLGYGTVDTVQEYVSIVLSNSVYPESFEVEHEAEFDPGSAELRLKMLVPAPGQLPAVKIFRYVKRSDEIKETPLSEKARKDRYAGAVQQVALRALHDVFQADRRELIQAIAVEVGTEAADPATGQQTWVPFVAVATTRDRYEELDLSAVVPSATLDHLGASTSKNPFGLIPVDVGGVRRT